jgi:hypothetical protein
MQPARSTLLLVVGTALATLALAGCSSGPTNAIATLPLPIGQANQISVGPGGVQVNAISARVVQGQRYHFEVFTHCGFTANSFDFDGSFWTVVGPGDDGNGNPPQGVGNPRDSGVIQLIGANAAIFTTAAGLQIPLERAVVQARVFLCD